jgi:hypothetical protein
MSKDGLRMGMNTWKHSAFLLYVLAQKENSLRNEPQRWHEG